jgi:AcrR family transcriptional regulator
MSRIDRPKAVKSTRTDAGSPRSGVGRKRDSTLDVTILEATIEILAQVGFDGMTMDMVAARAKAGKAALYRRWPSKTRLVQDALTWMNQNRFEADRLPDTGSLRGDLLALVRPRSIKEAQRKLRVLAGLGAFFSQQSGATKGGDVGILKGWDEANRRVIQRAIERGEIPARAEVDLACQVMIAMASFRGVIQHKPLDMAIFAELIDGIILPALRNPRPRPIKS